MRLARDVRPPGGHSYLCGACRRRGRQRGPDARHGELDRRAAATVRRRLGRRPARPRRDADELGTPQSVGDGYIYKVVVSEPSDVPVLADGVTLTFQLPSQAGLVASKVTRGSGCTGTVTLTCNLGFVTPQQSSEAEITVTVKEPGDLVANASVANAYGDRNPANNSASLELRLAPAVASPVVTPRALAAGVTRRGTSSA